MTPTVVKGIPADEIDVVWPMIEPLVGMILERTHGHSLDSVHASLRDGHWQLFVTWPGLETICITHQIDRPTEKVMALFGKASLKMSPDWRDHLDALQNWSRSIGCTAVEIWAAREGWARLLPDYEQAAILLRKDLR